MSRPSKGFLITLAIALGVCGFRRESSARYHMDTLREESTTKAFLGPIPIWSSTRPRADRFAGLYQTISGQPEDSTRWQKSPSRACMAVLGYSGFGCGSFRFEFAQRRQMLEALFKQYRAKPDQGRAAELLRRIDSIFPAPYPKDRKLAAPDTVDALRQELGLEPRFSR